MERKLQVVRAAVLATFFVALALTGWSLFTNRSSFVWFAFLAYLSLCIFIGTESFGPIAAQRATVSRVLARVFFVPSLIVVCGAGYSLVLMALS
jgi:hypothetical protein